MTTRLFRSLLLVALTLPLPALAADGDHCGDPDQAMDTSKLVQEMPNTPNGPKDTTTLSIRDGYGNSKFIRVKMPEGSGEHTYAVESGYYVKCELTRKKTLLMRELKTLAGKNPPDPGTPAFEKAVALKMRVDAIDHELNSGDQTKETIGRYSALLTYALEKCRKPGSPAGGEVSCSGDDAKKLKELMDQATAYDQQFAKGKKADLAGAGIGHLFGTADASAHTYQGNIVLSKLGVGQLACGDASCSLGAVAKPPAGNVAPPPVANVAPPPPALVLNPGDKEGKALTDKEIATEGTRFSVWLQALRKCVDSHMPPPGKPLGSLDTETIDQAFEKDFNRSKGSLSGPAGNLTSTLPAYQAALTKILGAPDAKLTESAAVLSSGGTLNTYGKSYEAFLAALASSSKAALDKAKDDETLKNDAIAIRNGVADLRGIVQRQFPIAAMASASECHLVNRDIAWAAGRVHKLTGEGDPAKAKYEIRTKSGPCLWTDTDIVKNLEQVMTALNTENASDGLGGDQARIDALKKKLGALAPSERAAVFRMIAEFSKKRFTGKDEAAITAARAELTDLVEHLVAAFK